MQEKQKKIIIIICFVIAIILTATITGLIVNSYNKNERNKTNEIFKENSSSKKEEIKEENIKSEIEENIKNNNDNKTDSENKDDDTVKENNKTKPNESIIESKPENKTEEDVINYVKNVSETSSKTALKEGFVKVVDFLFYDGEIYGKTFKELSNYAKIKIISLAIKIDSKIEEYVPGYKETISTTTNRVYTNLKTKLVTLYLDTTVKICNSNPTLCEDAKEGLQELKDSFGLTWNFIKEISGIGIAKLKDWYEVWKEE